MGGVVGVGILRAVRSGVARQVNAAVGRALRTGPRLCGCNRIGQSRRVAALGETARL